MRSPAAFTATTLALLAACGAPEAPRGPAPTLLLAQAQFVQEKQADGTTKPVPGPARLLLVRDAGGSWQTDVIEDPESNVFHKVLPWGDGGLLTIGANGARLKTWRREGDTWRADTHWAPVFGGKFDRLRDLEQGDVDGDGKPELAIATHDQGVIAVVHPEEDWRIEEIDRQPSTFVHEIEIGDVDGDGVAEIYATPSNPNKLEEEQPGEVRVYRHADGGWTKGLVDAPGDTHAKEILVADVDGTGRPTLFVVWEGAIGAGGALARPVAVKAYRWQDGAYAGTEVTTLPDRQTRALAAGDVNGDGKVDLVAGAFTSGLWLLEQGPNGWRKTHIDRASSGFEHPVHLADLDGDGVLEVYVASEDQRELRRYAWRDGTFVKTVLAPLRKSDITWNIGDARL